MKSYIVRSICIGSLLIFLGAASHAAVSRVDSTADDGAGSLRQAIRDASNDDVIMIRVEAPIVLTSKILIENKTIRIEGESGPMLHSVSGGGQTTLFEIAGSANVTIARLTLANGKSETDGGAIVINGILALENVVVTQSYAQGSGGAVFQSTGSLLIDRCYFLDNESGANGGAIAVAGGSVNILSTGFGGDSLAGNTAGALGGALYLESAATGAVFSSTFSSNKAQGGGAIAINDTNLRAVNLTLVSNFSDTMASAHIDVGSTATLTLVNSLIQSDDPAADGIGGTGTITIPEDLNLTGTLAELGLGDPGDFGGTSPTYPVLPGSPAIDAGDDTQLPDFPEPRDQRGLARFSDGDGDRLNVAVDLGAFEIQNYLVTAAQIRGSATGGVDDQGFGNTIDPSDDGDSIASADIFVVLSNAGKADIGDAVGANNSAGGGSISFSSDLEGKVLALKGKELKVRRNVAVYGPGADRLSISGGNRSQVIRVSDGALLHIRDISLVDGWSIDGGGILVEGDSRLEMEAVSLDDNAASGSGGAVAVLSGNAIIYRSSLLDNSAGATGGAVYGSADSEIYINNSTLSGNSASQGAGAVRSTGLLGIDSSTLVGNTVPAIQLGSSGNANVWNSILLSSGASVSLDDPDDILVDSDFNLSDSFEPQLPDGSYLYVPDQPVVESQRALNGGSTESHLPVPNSPAIDTGFDTGISGVDQRGAERPSGRQNDIGSIEIQNDVPEILRTNNPVIVECGSLFSNPATATVVVFDADGDALTVEWKVGGQTFTDPVPASNEVSRTFNVPYGMTIVTVSVSDLYTTSPEREISILVVDNTYPTLSVSADQTVPADPTSCEQTVSIGFTASDTCTGVTSITYSVNDGSPVSASLTSPLQLSLGIGVNEVDVTATDGAGNFTTKTVLVTVEDVTDPVLTLPADIVQATDQGECFATVIFAASVAQDCSGTKPIVYTLNGTVISSGHPFPYGDHTVDVYVEDGAGNSDSGSFMVTVTDEEDPYFTSAIPVDMVVQTDPGYCTSQQSFSLLAADDCSGLKSLVYSVTNADEDTSVIGQFPYRFERGINKVTATATDNAGNTSSVDWLVEVKDDGNNCIYNLAWPHAYELSLSAPPADPNVPEEELDPNPPLFGNFQQYLAFTDQARWYKFFVKPGSRLTVLLTQLPANYDIVVYRDIEAEYLRLRDLFLSDNPEDKELSLLGVEFAPEAFSPEAFSPEAFSPEAFSPEAFSPEAFSPEAFSPEAFSPEAFSPEAFSPEAFSPEAFSPEAFSPEAFSPEAFSPEAFSPEAFSPEAFSPEAFSPEAFSPEAFSSAQISSIAAYSAFPGVASEGVSLNSFTESGYYYVRVRGSNGAFSTESTFQLDVVVEQDLCVDVKTADELGDPTYSAHVAGDYRTLIIWDSMLMPDPDGVIDAKLKAFAARPDIMGAVVDVSDEERVNLANVEALDYPECIYAKNLVANEIKKVIDLWWGLNPNTLEYLVLVGNDAIIPFFRTADEAFLANEANYIPPVRDSTHSQSALRYGQVLTQDPYGAECELNLRTGSFPYPKLAIGRLVESPEDILAQIDNYIDIDGLIQPTSALVTGYDFLDDAAREVEKEFAAALNSAVDTLIADGALPPELGWTANDLANAFLGKRHDMVFLAGHFSTGSSLAADYETRLTAAQVLDSNADLLNSLIFSIGCHSGYNTVDEHAINGVTKQPDWAQVFGKMGATFIAGTGYQYGDTEFVEYGERLYLEFTRQLRTGTGAVPVGKALVEAKKRYLADTPLMRGIHEKTLIQTTLFGLPMMRVDVPGARLQPTPSSSVVPSGGLQPTTGPGAVLGLQTYNLTVYPSLTQTTTTLEVQPLEPLPAGVEKETVTATWYTGKDGSVTNPVEPTRPLEVYNVAVPDTLLRGVGFLRGSYEEIYGILPFTGAPATEIRGVYGNFFTEVFFPSQLSSTNYLGTICGGTDGERLNVFPTQFISRFGIEEDLGGTYRAYDQMEFKLFYNNNTTVYKNAFSDEIIPALAPQPTIARVQSEIVGDTVEFSINVMGSPAAGIQEVWITHTRDVGVSKSGAWESVGLTQDTTDTTLWKGVLPLGGIDPDTVRFIVQAASGTGLVALSTNYGQYYIPGRDSSALRTKTRVTGLSGPISAEVRYGDAITVSANFEYLVAGTDDWKPLAGANVEFRVGTSRIRGVTDPDGDLTKTFKVTTRPKDNLLLQANYAGDSTFAASSAEEKITVNKQLTTLTPVDPPLENVAVYGSDVVFALTAGSDVPPNESTPLKERTVFFLVEYFLPDDTTVPNGERFGNPVITDFAGRADLAEVFLPAGKARITAYFNDIELPDGSNVTITDALYEAADPASVIVTLRQPAIDDSLGFDPTQVDVYYKSSGNGKNAAPPAYTNASITGEVAFNVPLQPQDLLDGLDTYPFIEARVEARLSGTTIASEAGIMLDTRGNNGNHWTTTSRPGFAVSYVGIHWSNAPRFDSALSGSPGPRIYTAFIGNNLTEYHLVPVPGSSFTTQFPNGGPTIEFNGGEPVVKPNSGLDYNWDGVEMTFSVKSGLVPGDSFIIVIPGSDKNSDETITVVAEAGVNYLEEGGRMIIRLTNVDIPADLAPTSDDPNNYLECRVILGPEDGVNVRSVARIGDGLFAVPWSSEDPGHKQYRD